jgi:hypothetical protein
MEADTKNKFAFRGSGGTEGFTRIPSRSAAPVAQPAVAQTETEAALAAAMAAAVHEPDVEKRAEAQSRALIKSASGGLASNALVVNIAKMSLLGMLGGALYGLARGTAESQGVLYELKYKTSAFDMDPFASKLFHKLGRYEYLQPDCYKFAIHYCDKLFLLERHLIHNNPTDSDVPMAQSFIDGVFAQIMLLRNKSETGTQRGEINVLMGEIKGMMRDHLKRIFNRCAPLRL